MTLPKATVLPGTRASSSAKRASLVEKSTQPGRHGQIHKSICSAMITLVLAVSRAPLLIATALHAAATLAVDTTVPVNATDYLCEVAQQGFHILERVPCGVRVWKHSASNDFVHIPFASSTNGSGAHCLDAPASGWKLFSRTVEEKLHLLPRLQYQQPWRYFRPQGSVVGDRDIDWEDAMRGGAIFLLEGGQFQWPPVRVGFHQSIDGLVYHNTQIKLITLALNPPIFRVDGLASASEARELIAYAEPRFKKSGVLYMDKDQGKEVDTFRTSVDYRPRHQETPLIASIQRRAAAVTRMPTSHLERCQILKYGTGGRYVVHDDASRLEFASHDENEILRTHYGFFDRMLTLFWYLNSVPAGGETNFPMADTDENPSTMLECVQGLWVTPVQGTAILWYNMDATGKVNPRAEHAACKVKEGLKYGINVWVFNKPSNTRPAKMDRSHPEYKAILERARAEAEDEEHEDL